MKIFITGVALLLSLLIYIGYLHIFKELKCVDQVTISSIGGCNRDACGVRYSDGTIGDRRTPVVGEVVCTRKKWVDK